MTTGSGAVARRAVSVGHRAMAAAPHTALLLAPSQLCSSAVSEVIHNADARHDVAPAGLGLRSPSAIGEPFSVYPADAADHGRSPKNAHLP